MQHKMSTFRSRKQEAARTRFDERTLHVKNCSEDSTKSCSSTEQNRNRFDRGQSGCTAHRNDSFSEVFDSPVLPYAKFVSMKTASARVGTSGVREPSGSRKASFPRIFSRQSDSESQQDHDRSSRGNALTLVDHDPHDFWEEMPRPVGDEALEYDMWRLARDVKFDKELREFEEGIPAKLLVCPSRHDDRLMAARERLSKCPIHGVRKTGRPKKRSTGASWLGVGSQCTCHQRLMLCSNQIIAGHKTQEGERYFSELQRQQQQSSLASRAGMSSMSRVSTEESSDDFGTRSMEPSMREKGSIGSVFMRSIKKLESSIITRGFEFESNNSIQSSQSSAAYRRRSYSEVPPQVSRDPSAPPTEEPRSKTDPKKDYISTFVVTLLAWPSRGKIGVSYKNKMKKSLELIQNEPADTRFSSLGFLNGFKVPRQLPLNKQAPFVILKVENSVMPVILLFEKHEHRDKFVKLVAMMLTFMEMDGSDGAHI